MEDGFMSMAEKWYEDDLSRMKRDWTPEELKESRECIKKLYCVSDEVAEKVVHACVHPDDRERLGL